MSHAPDSIPTEVLRAEQAPASAYYALGMLAAVNLFCSADRLIIGVLIEPIKAEFQLSETQVGALSGMSYAIFYGLALVPIGMLADRFSRRKVIAVCLAIWSAMTALSSQAGTYAHLFAFRIMVGIGEAGNSAPGVSLIADYFPAARRPGAISAFFMASSLGMLLAFAGGGWIAQYYGWRAAMFTMGAPGLVLAALLWTTVRDPPQEQAGARADTAPLPLREALRSVAADKSVVHAIAGIGLMNFVAAGVAIWSSAFLIRTYNLNIGIAGSLLAITAVAGIAGAYVGGKLGDRYGARDTSALGRISCIAVLLNMVSLGGFLLARDLHVAVACLMTFGFLQTAYLGPAFSLIQNLITPRARATINSMVYLISSVFGFGLGPFVTGALSQQLSSHGVDALRYSLLAVSTAALWSALHFAMAARPIRLRDT